MSPEQSRQAWLEVERQLRVWRDEGDRLALGAALRFVEEQLRLAVPSAVRRGLPPGAEDDAINGLLEQLIKRPLPDDLEDLRFYLLKMFRNRCIDLGRKVKAAADRDARFSDEWPVHAPPMRTPEDEIGRAQTRDAVGAAVDGLSMEDRVAVKLEHAPEWLTTAELAWIAGRLKVSAEVAKKMIRGSHGTYELTTIFDPSADDRKDAGTRERRLDRFRKRVSRAMAKLQTTLRGVR